MKAIELETSLPVDWNLYILFFIRTQTATLAHLNKCNNKTIVSRLDNMGVLCYINAQTTAIAQLNWCKNITRVSFMSVVYVLLSANMKTAATEHRHLSTEQPMFVT